VERGGERGFIVVGPESSGTKLTAALLRAAGCRSWGALGGDDPEPEEGTAGPPVVRRSFPHAGRWQAMTDLLDLFSPEAQVEALVTTRDWRAMAASQVDRSFAHSVSHALGNIRRVYREIFRGLDRHDTPFFVVTHEAMTGRPGYQEWLLTQLGLPGATVAVRESNAKWYSDGGHTGSG
jgi:hypothetical protein